MPKLNQTFVASIGQVTDETWFWDTELKGFHVRVRPGKAPVWGIRYTHEGKKRTSVIAPCHELKAEKARDRAIQIKNEARLGVDIVEDRRAKAKAPTLVELAEIHAEIQKPPKISERYYLDKKAHWKTHILPAIGSIKVADLSASDVERFHLRFKDQPALANALLATLSKAISDSIKFKPPWRLDNPCSSVTKFTVNRRERILSREEARHLFEKLADLRSRSDNLSTWSIPWLIEMLLITGLRLRELANRRWSEIDLEVGTLTIPKPKGKKKDRHVSLSLEAVGILMAMPRRSEWVFPNSIGTGPFVSPQKHWIPIRHELGLDDVRIHDIRHTVASYAMHEGGLSQREVMELLGHSQMSTTERYLNVHDEQKRRISDVASKALRMISSGASDRGSSRRPGRSRKANSSPQVYTTT